MSELQQIEATLQAAALRRRWARALRGLWRGLLVGASGSLLVLGIYHLRHLPLWIILMATFLPMAAMAVGFVIGWWRKPDLAQVARWVDGKQNLKERLSSAWELSQNKGPATGLWRELVLHDAVTHARELDPRRLVPFHLSRAARWAVLILAVTAGLGFVPEYRSAKYLQQQADAQNIAQTGRQLAELTRRTLEKRPPALDTTQKSLESVMQLGDQLAKHNLSRAEAIKELGNMAEKLKEDLREMGNNPDLKKLQQAARNPSGGESQNAAGLQKQMESLQKQLGTPTGNPEALDNFKKSLQKLQEAAKNLAQNNSSGADAEREKLSQSLSALSRQAQQMGFEAPNLDQAIEALAANQTDLFLKELEQASTDLEKLRDMAKSLQQLQQQAEKIGKDLAEQLQNGQPEAAQSTLQKMVDQLNASKLAPEQMKKLMEEVGKAIDPAGKYGKVAEHLKQASSEMKADKKGEASQSLAAAAKELDKLMQQMGDAKEMMATLENLNAAAQCIGSGQGWKPGKPGMGPGGQPGGGVGTWADESGEWDGQTTAGWDNSGIERPDMDSRGQTDRGNGDLSDALKPTKVKGQFTPGGQMPSVTLRGVSIKGLSQVDFKEAAAAAQSDAESALSQEKVPRAYQGPVRDYFDDIKK